MKNGIIIVGVVAAIFAVAYFTSDVFSTKVDQAAKQWAKWTPENIQKDPAGYLAFAKTQLEKANDTLEARHIALKTKQNEYKTKHTQQKYKKQSTKSCSSSCAANTQMRRTANLLRSPALRPHTQWK
jgi:exonuclease VII large subunit